MKKLKKLKIIIQKICKKWRGIIGDIIGGNSTEIKKDRNGKYVIYEGNRKRENGLSGAATSRA